MKLGINMINRGPMATPENLVRFARLADEIGFDSLTLSDHIVIPKAMPDNYPYHPEGEFDWRAARDYFEPLATLMFLAGCTNRIRLGTSVLIISYRNPITTAKMLATIDVLSGGRMFCGVGAGWWENEYKALGIPGHFQERGARTDEYLRIFKTLWTEENPAFQGEFFQFSDFEFSPRPVQAGGVPIWVGGHTKRAMRRAVELGDAWHPIGLRPPANLDPAELTQHIETLHKMCEKAGRDPATLQVCFRAQVTLTDKESRPLVGSKTQVLDDLHGYQSLGVDHLTMDLVGETADDLADQIQQYGEELLPAFNG